MGKTLLPAPGFSAADVRMNKGPAGDGGSAARPSAAGEAAAPAVAVTTQPEAAPAAEEAAPAAEAPKP